MKAISSAKMMACLVLLSVGTLGAKPAWAMHISEGILPLGWAILWWLFIIPFLFIGLRLLARESRRDLSYKPLAGFVAALVFVISLMPIPVPIAGTCAHPAGTAISGIILGPFVSVVTATVALLLQALLLAHGGLSTLGANVLAMGVMGSFTGWLTFLALRRLGAGLGPAGFAAGVMADWATYATTALVLSLGISGDAPFFPLFTRVILAFLPTQVPLGLLEGAMTGGILVLLANRRPDILRKLNLMKPGEVRA
jgi:cobalt/nickel transport system permease protein